MVPWSSLSVLFACVLYAAGYLLSMVPCSAPLCSLLVFFMQQAAGTTLEPTQVSSYAFSLFQV